MAESKGKASRITDYLIAFVLVYIVAQLIMHQFFPSTPAVTDTGVSLRPQSVTMRLGASAPTLTVHNATKQTVQIPIRCPQPPFDVAYLQQNGSSATGTLVPLSATGTAIPCDQIQPIAPIAPGKEAQVSLNAWKYSLFSKTGTYQVSLPKNLSGVTLSASGSVAHVTVVEPNAFIKLFRAVITKPFLNFLIFAASILPNHSLAIAIIILTLLVKILLFIPTQHALEGQKKMQLLQPKLESVRKQYKDNPTRMQEETMKLWKEYKVNPLQSCVPILVQFPVLIGLLYVIRDDVNLQLSRDFIYPIYQHLTWGFNTNFFGLDLTQPNVWLFPPLLVVLQFIQIKLSLVIADRKKAKQIEKAEEKTGMEMQQKVMLYVFPLMIGFFAFRYPAALSLYWGVSTLFAIGQQILVNREHIKA
ncbi:MAG TPA: YidC/Oxa1 family membrane protein insertase [Candidatus Peribacteraceae bacterium]|nr:YidC/Oxa1 family membrane protein insertase [Candidatus Peribacteraceae bacterium]